MKKGITKWVALLLTGMAVCMFGLVGLVAQIPETVQAAETKSGTIGKDDGITWTYDEETKTLTVTGEDEIVVKSIFKSPSLSGAVSEFRNEIEYVVIKDLTLSGTASSMFQNFHNLKSIEMHNFDTKGVITMNSMFFNCYSLESLDLSGFDTENVTGMVCMFTECSSLNSLNISNFDTKKVTDMAGMFVGCSSLSRLDMSSFDLSGLKTSENSSDGSPVSGLFFRCDNLNTIYAPTVVSQEFPIPLQGVFYDERMNEVSTITPEFAGRILTQDGTSSEQPQTNGWKEVSDSNYWYENGVKQGTYYDPKGVVGDGTVRGREIYDPVSDGWYWLDAVYDGAKAINKEVWMPYIYQDEAGWEQDEIRFNAEASGDMAEQVIREINNRTGKWVRYDENGKMYKGWYTVEGAQADIYPDQVGNTYYYDHRTGLMAKGEVEIDGVVYYFDSVTGVLQ